MQRRWQRDTKHTTTTKHNTENYVEKQVRFY